MAGSPKSEVDLVEFAYALEPSPQEWIEEIGKTLRRSVPGVVSCFALEVRREGMGEIWAEDAAVVDVLRNIDSQVSVEFTGLFTYEPLLAKTSREILERAGIQPESTPLPGLFAKAGIVEQFGVAATDPSGRGAVLGMCLDSLEGPAKDDRVTLAQIGAHIAAGARLRQDRRGQSIVDAGDAILTPEGKLEHADASRLPDPSAATRELLGEAVKRVEQAKQRGRSAQEALALWWGLVDGRWSLVSHFEGSGRRYYVAVENPPESAKHRALSRPEAETVAYIASGTSTRDTAYALGLDTVTVRRHLRNAMAKLGIRTRVELIAFRATLLGHLEPTCVGA